MIARYLAPLAGTGALGLGDDAASFSPPEDCDLVLTKDALVAGIHFFADDPPEAIAQKALRVNLSDLAAKGATPLVYLLGLGLPDGWTEDYLARFTRGLAADQADYGLTLLGGDTVRAPERLTLSVTAIGSVPHGCMVRRGGARVGDLVLVTGTIGDAALGLRLRLDPELAGRLRLLEADREHLLARYLLPQPRMVLAAAARQHASAGMDISDGLAGDFAKMAAVSGVAIEIEAARVPLSPAARAACLADPDLLAVALTGGDDYELALAAAPSSAAALVAAGEAVGVPVTIIGRVTAGQGLTVTGPDGMPLDLGPGSFSHF
ncbi:thiamine-phosphate kinase [Methylobrevis sp. L22]|uniref:Thiamine-monophosphate kinase n=1 Tax=Methylobrevis albus TaxID=2793297 RepID=A0A931N0E9_9HYPH|nr:thiamine-phosphate kinase [Methylobrevis albus]